MSMRKMAAALALLSVCLLALFFLLPRQPEKPLELQLKLAKNRILANEWLWYLVEMKNVGRKPVKIDDSFWFKQSELLHSKQTRFEIMDPDGQQVSANYRSYDPWVGHPRFWTNDCGGGQDCVDLFKRASWPTRVLKGGETMTATPSMLSAVRPRSTYSGDDPGDPRDLPEIPKGWPKEKVEALRRQWKAIVEQSAYTMGDPTFRRDSKEPAAARPRGYRVLDVYDGMFEKVGKYRMRVVYAPDLGPAFDWEEKEKWVKENLHESLRTFLSRHGWPKETRVFKFESNWVEFEVLPPPFPEHLFHHNADESAEKRALIDRYRQEMRERSIWAEDSPGERARKELRDRQETEKRNRKFEMLRAKAAELGGAK